VDLPYIQFAGWQSGQGIGYLCYNFLKDKDKRDSKRSRVRDSNTIPTTKAARTSGDVGGFFI
jgi:hypothetical protein